jgi:hypothetical protein
MLLSSTPLQVFELHRGRYEPVAPNWLEAIGLGLTVWQGTFEQEENAWLRWCDKNGLLIPLGEERAEQERQRADKAEQRLARLEAQLRQHGIDPGNGGPPADQPE